MKVYLFVGLTIFQVSLKNNPENIVGFLKVCKFLTQKMLEAALYYLKIQDRGREIVLKNFRGQLELDRVTKMPFWKVYLETTGLITKKCLSKALLKSLFPALGKDKDKFVDFKQLNSSLKVWYASNLEKLVEEDRFSIPNSDWWPGYFDKKTLDFQELLSTNEVQFYLKFLTDENEVKYLKNIVKKTRK